MAVTKSQQAAVNRYVSEKYDRVNLTLPKGMREEIDSFVQASGKYRNSNTGKGSVNQFIRDAIQEKMMYDPNIYQKLRNKRKWFDWYHSEASADEKCLSDKVFELSDKYFSDFRFESQTIIDDFIAARTKEGDKWVDAPFEIPYDFILYFDQIVLESLLYKVEPLEEGVVGQFSYVDYSITIPKEYLNDDAVILHELIHIYESAIDKIPKFYHDILLICLYKDLQKKIDDLDDRVVAHTHVFFGNEITEYGGNHDILFFLKSLDLDLRCGYKLGTVCGYGRDEYDSSD